MQFYVCMFSGKNLSMAALSACTQLLTPLILTVIILALIGATPVPFNLADYAKKKAEAEALAAAENARKNSQSKQVLASYKINLRNTIGQKIDFTRVIGDGDCAVTFKVDSTGRLTNRAFAKQSTNITLNNAVYNAVMAVPSYSAPPAAYKNETLTLHIRFQNGNFAITLE